MGALAGHVVERDHVPEMAHSGKPLVTIWVVAIVPEVV
jgi:hypothetical protein